MGGSQLPKSFSVDHFDQMYIQQSPLIWQEGVMFQDLLWMLKSNIESSKCSAKLPCGTTVCLSFHVLGPGAASALWLQYFGAIRVRKSYLNINSTLPCSAVDPVNRTK